MVTEPALLLPVIFTTGPPVATHAVSVLPSCVVVVYLVAVNVPAGTVTTSGPLFVNVVPEGTELTALGSPCETPPELQSMDAGIPWMGFEYRSVHLPSFVYLMNMSMFDCTFLPVGFASTAEILYSTQLYEAPPKTAEALTEDPVAVALPLVPLVPVLALPAVVPLFPLVLLPVNPPELADPVVVPDAAWFDLLLIFPTQLLDAVGHSFAIAFLQLSLSQAIFPIKVFSVPGSM
jgi:hypothetical protein